MFCENCGATVESDSKFCDSCGKALELSVTSGQPTTALDPTEHLGRRWGKPLLIIALLAVAATAAVIVYEKVGGSLPPDSNTAQKSPSAVTSALNSVKAAIADGTTDKHLTRPAALIVLSKETSRWRGTVYCPLVLRPSANRLQQALISTGYSTQPAWVSLYGTTTGTMGLTAKASSWPTTETLMVFGSKPDLIAQIPIVSPVVIQVTGISQNGNEAGVEFTWRWMYDPQLFDLARAVGGFGAFLGENEQIVASPEQKGVALLRLYDDGWRNDTLRLVSSTSFTVREDKRIVVLGNCDQSASRIFSP